MIEAVKSTKFRDDEVLGGLTYSYYVTAYDSAGRHSPPSNVIRIRMTIPDFSTPSPEDRHA